MEQEAAETLHIGVALAFLGVVVFFVLFNLRFGEKLMNKVIDRTADQNDSGVVKTFDNFLSDSPDGGLILPAAAAYSFTGYNGSHIDKVVCFHTMHDAADRIKHHYSLERDEAGRYGVTSYPDAYNDLGTDDIPDVCLKRHMEGHVRMRAVFNRESGLYILYVYPCNAL